MTHHDHQHRMISHCPACRSDRWSRRFTKNGWRIRACRACGSWFVANPPTDDRLREIYRQEYFTEYLAQHAQEEEAAAWRAAVANARRRLALIRRYAPRARTLLDVGCGTGAFLSVAREAYECCGVDVSAEATAVVRDRLNVEAHAGDLRSRAPSLNPKDVICMLDVVEHVPDPADVLETVRTLLTRRGIILLTTGDTDSLVCRMTGRAWHLMTPPEHLTFFSKTGLIRMVERCGLSVEHVSHRPVAANIGYMAEKIAAVMGPPLRWLPRLTSLCALAKKDVDVNLLDVVTLIARPR
ncbi:MAG: class I SAM-dependent methyltransferase [Phycisphaerae bacterium]|nr:class I SAM-dependent methyltransferase [Phycisphaerae bacterium]